MKNLHLAFRLIAAVIPLVGAGLLHATPFQANGIKINEVDQSSAIVWMRLTSVETGNSLLVSAEAPGAEGSVRVQLWPTADPTTVTTTAWQAVDPAANHTRQIALSGLTSGTDYTIHCEARPAGGGAVSSMIEGAFQTTPAPNLIQPVLATEVTGQELESMDSGSGDDTVSDAFPSAAESPPEAASAVFTVPSSDVQYYEVVPGVIPVDGSETFRVYVHLGRAVDAVYLDTTVSRFPVSRTTFLDDGTDGDLAANDGIYTSGVFSYNTAAFSYPLTYITDVTGINYASFGNVRIREADLTTVNKFNVNPKVGLIDPGLVPTTDVATLSPDIQAASHFVNVRRTGPPSAQNALHNLGTSDLSGLTQSIYSEIPDNYDFLILGSAMHGEKLGSSSNFTAGAHHRVKNIASGIGIDPQDDTALYGSSSGRLMSINLIDTADRGNKINNVLHELTHQWSSFFDGGLGLGQGHWDDFSNVGSILGGYEWIPQPDGSWLVDKDHKKSNLSRMALLDRYTAGFIEADAVPDILVYDQSTTHPETRAANDTPIQPGEIVTTVTIEDIIAVEGERLPSSTESQKHFNMLFVVESIDRLLTPSEMTFYNLLAREFERVLPPGEANPALGGGN